MSYVERVLEQLKAKNPAQPEFIQAATEVLNSLKPLLDAEPHHNSSNLPSYSANVQQ